MLWSGKFRRFPSNFLCLISICLYSLPTLHNDSIIIIIICHTDQMVFQHDAISYLFFNAFFFHSTLSIYQSNMKHIVLSRWQAFNSTRDLRNKIVTVVCHKHWTPINENHNKMYFNFTI